MATFGNGIRAEYKRYFNPQFGVSANFNILNVPSGANYFIFINKIIMNGVTQLNLYNDGVDNTFPATISPKLDLDIASVYLQGSGFIDFLHGISTYSYVSGNPDVDPDGGFPFNKRYIKPNGYLNVRSNGLAWLLIEYQEIYFGGLHNY